MTSHKTFFLFEVPEKTKCSLDDSGLDKRSKLETCISWTLQCESLNYLGTWILFLRVGKGGIRRGTKTNMCRPLSAREAAEEKQDFISQGPDQPFHWEYTTMLDNS